MTDFSANLPQTQLCATCSRYEPGDQNYTPLHAACKNNHPACVRLLLQRPGVCVNQYDMSGYTPLIVASMSGATDCVQLLLEHPNINIDAVTKRVGIRDTPPTGVSGLTRADNK